MIEFFQALSDGDYKEAVRLYGGSYQYLRSINPQNEADDLAGLWQAGCEVNGLVCLSVGEVIESTQVSELEALFIVEFREDDGGTFSLGPCCGTQETQAAPLTRFEFHVINRDGIYQIKDMPVILP